MNLDIVKTIESIINTWKQYSTTKTLPTEDCLPKVSDWLSRALVIESAKRPVPTLKELVRSVAQLGDVYRKAIDWLMTPVSNLGFIKESWEKIYMRFWRLSKHDQNVTFWTCHKVLHFAEIQHCSSLWEHSEACGGSMMLSVTLGLLVSSLTNPYLVTDFWWMVLSKSICGCIIFFPRFKNGFNGALKACSKFGILLINKSDLYISRTLSNICSDSSLVFLMLFV